MSTTRGERDQRIHQVVFRWTDQHLLGGRGIGPVGTSLGQRDLAWWSGLLDNGDLVGLLHPDRPALGLLRPQSRPGMAVIVRADAVPTSSRGSHQLHALVGTADVLTARLAFGLRDWDGWLPPADGSLADPQLPALDPADLEAASTLPGRADPQEVAALLRHVLRHPDYHFHFAGAASDPYALGHALASLLDVSLIVEGDVQAAAVQPRIAVTVEKTHLRIPPAHWYRKSPASRAPLEDWAEDIGYLVEQVLAAPSQATPRRPQELLQSLSHLRYQRQGLYRLLRQALRIDTQGEEVAKARRYLAQDDGLRWAQGEFTTLSLSETTELCRFWRDWPSMPEQLTAFLRSRVASLALDWEDTPELDSLRAAGQRLFTSPSSAHKRSEQIRPVFDRIARLWQEGQGRSTIDRGVLLWHARQLADLSATEVQALVEKLEVPAAHLIVLAAHYTGDPGTREFRRGLLGALQQCATATQDHQEAVRAELQENGFLLEALADETAERRRELFGSLLVLGYGPPQAGQTDPQLSRQLEQELTRVGGHPLFHSLLPIAARHLTIASRLRIWREFPHVGNALPLDGASTYLAGRLLRAQTVEEFLQTLRLLFDLRCTGALQVHEFQQVCQEHEYFQEKLYAFRDTKDPYGEAGLDIIFALAELMWLASGEMPPEDRECALSEKKVRELEREERFPDPPYFRLALIRVSATHWGHTATSERLWNSFPLHLSEHFRRHPGLVQLVGAPPIAETSRRWGARRKLWPRAGEESTRNTSEAPSLPLDPSHPAVEDRDSEIKSQDLSETPHRDAGRAATTYRLPEPGGAAHGADDNTTVVADEEWDAEPYGTGPRQHRSDEAPLVFAPPAAARKRTWLSPAVEGWHRLRRFRPWAGRTTRTRKPEKQSFTYPGLGPWARTALAVVAAVLIILAVIALILYFSFRLLNSPVNGIPQSSQSVSAPPAPSPTSPSLSSEETFR